MYDIIAKKSIIYAYIYPFIEFALGFMYLFGFIPLATAIITIVIMGISAIGVLQKLNNREVLMCACLGMVFQVPMTWVTFFEDVLMIVMAFLMIYGL